MNMKKLVIFMMLLFNLSIFAEKLTTNGNYNLDKLKGTWDSIFATIITKNNKWYFVDENPAIDEAYEQTVHEIKVYQKGVLVIPNYYKNNKDRNLYFAYDMKYKTMVTLDKDLNVITKEKRRVECLHNNTCN
jgi:hypothetical protein